MRRGSPNKNKQQANSLNKVILTSQELTKQQYFKNPLSEENLGKRSYVSQAKQIKNGNHYIKPTEYPDLRRSSSQIKLPRKSFRKKDFDVKLESIQTRISELKSLLQKRKEKKNERQLLKLKIYERRKFEGDERTKKYWSLQKNKQLENERESFMKKILTRDVNAQLQGLVTQVPQTNSHTFKFNPYLSSSNQYYISEVKKAYKDEQSTVTEHINTSIQLFKSFQSVKLPSQKAIVKRRMKLPKQQGYQDKKTIIFDLDETLIHCNETTQQKCDAILPITFPTGDIVEAGINVRPGAFKILQQLSKYFEVLVFTASHYCYGNVVIDYLDPKGEYIHHRLFRQHCYFVPPHGPYVKDLRILDRDLSKTVLVDNAAYSYAFQKQNGVPIIPYYSGSQDYELKALQTYLMSLLDVKDVREVNRKTFRLHEYDRFDDQIELVQQLYK